MSYKIGFWILLLLLLACVLFWFYRAIDKGVTNTYRRDEVERQISLLKDTLKDYSNSNSCSKDLRSFIKENYNQKSIYGEGADFIEYEGIKFKFKNGKLDKIETP